MRFFSSNNAFHFIFLPLTVLILWFYPLFNYQTINIAHIENEGILYSLMVDSFSDTPFLFIMINLVVVLFTAIYINLLHARYVFFENRTVLQSYLYVLFTSIIIYISPVHPGFITTFFLIPVVHNILASYKGEKQLTNIFFSGFFLAVACLFYIPVFWLIVPVWIGYFILTNNGLRIILLSITGFITVYVYVFAYYLYKKDIIHILYDLESTANVLKLSESIIPIYILSGLFLVLLILSIYIIIKGESRQKIKSWKYLIFLSVAVIINLILFIILKDTGVLIPFFVFSGILISNYFTLKKYHVFKQISFILVFILSLWIAFYPYIHLYIKI
ncbi:MAG: hypothetical protein Kow0068_09500 [Marinilabiliales bacterium]